MTFINLLLHDSCTISRATKSVVNGQETLSWSQVGAEIPCQVTTTGFDTQAGQQDSVQQVADGIAVFLPDADVRASDRLTASDGSVWTVLGQGGQQRDLYGEISHVEYLVRQVKP